MNNIYIIFILALLTNCSPDFEQTNDLLFIKSGIVKRNLPRHFFKENQKLILELNKVDSSLNDKFKRSLELVNKFDKYYVHTTSYSGGLKATGEFVNPLMKDSVDKYFFDENPYNSFAYKSFDSTLIEFRALITESRNMGIEFNPHKNRFINNFLNNKTDSPAEALFSDVTLVEAVEIIEHYELSFLIAINKELRNDLKKYGH